MNELVYEKMDTYKRYQKKYVITAIISFCVGVAMIILDFTLRPYLKRLASLTFNFMLNTIYDFGIRPIGLLAIGFFVLSVLSFWTDTRLEKRIRIVMLIIGFVLLLPTCWIAIELILLSFSQLDETPVSFVFSTLLFYETPRMLATIVMPILAGNALFMGFNRRKDETTRRKGDISE